MTSSLMQTKMNRNRKHVKIGRCGSWYNTFLWPRCLRIFAKLVGNWRPWDFKCTQVIQQRILSLWMPADCHPIWTTCQLYYVPGDILYGRVGRAASIRRWLLLYAADKVQKGGVDDPRDQNAIKIGMDLWDRPSLTPRFCSTVVVKIRSLDLHATSGCRRC